MIDSEKDLHVEEVKVRLKPADKDLLVAIAKKRDVPVAVLARTLLLRMLDDMDGSVRRDPEKRRAA